MSIGDIYDGFVFKAAEHKRQLDAQDRDRTGRLARAGNEELRDMIERQNLLLQTLIMLLLEKKVIGEDEFRQWMDYVDRLDGVCDGRVKEDRSPINCPACGRVNQRLARSCQYCGRAFEAEFLARRGG